MASGGSLIRLHLVLLPLVAACGGSALTEGEARSTFEGLNDVTDDVVLLSRDAAEQGARASLTVETSDDGLAIHGTATHGRDWSGLATVDGQVTADEDRFGYDLTVTLDHVELAHGPTLDGQVAVTFSVTELGVAAPKWTLEVGLDGELQLSGDADGRASVHYALTLEIDGWSVRFTAKGSLGGYDVSGWTYTDSTLVF